MNDLDLCFMPATTLVELIKSRQLSPVELMENTLSRLDTIEPHINGFIHRADDTSMEAARDAERRLLAGDKLGPLHGLPVSVKDLIEVAAMPCSYGSMTLQDNVASADAPSVERLRHAGAIIIGKTTTSEFGYRGYTKSLVHGNTKNIWDLGKTPGGSSGGAVSSVAAGVTALALGTDGGGSIRAPAAFTGLVGVKAQFGRVPFSPPSTTPTLAHVGPITRNTGDARLLLSVIAGADQRDHNSLLPEVSLLKSFGSAGHLRIAYSPTLGYARVDPEIAAVVDAAVCRLQDEFTQIETVLDVCPDPAEILATEFVAGCSARLGMQVDDTPELIDPPLLSAIKSFRMQTAGDYASVIRERLRHRQTMYRFFQRYDVLITPTTPVAAWPIEHEGVPPGYEDAKVWSYFTYPFNLSGQPACSVPCGFSAGGLPVGLQIAVRPLEEPLLLSMMDSVEAILGISGRPQEV